MSCVTLPIRNTLLKLAIIVSSVIWLVNFSADCYRLRNCLLLDRQPLPLPGLAPRCPTRPSLTVPHDASPQNAVDQGS